MYVANECMSLCMHLNFKFVYIIYAHYVEDRPSMKQLQQVMKREDVDITTQWRELGLELVDSNKILKEIGANHPNDVCACCRIMFERWLEITPDASWSQLITALNNARMNTAADAVSKLFQSGNLLLYVMVCN